MPKALLVIDEPGLHQAYAVALAEAGFEVLTFSHGHGILEAAVAARPDAIIADADTPGMSGFDLLDLLKHSHHLARTRVVLLSRVVSGHDRARARELGAADMATASVVAIGGVVRDLTHAPRR